MTTKPFFSREMFRFLKELKRNNRREWFEKNKDRYEVFVKLPLLGFISTLAAPLREISPAFVADPRPTGGSMFRIYRDTRFSKDKTPYKTHAAAQFRHRVGKDVHAPGFYLHLEPGGVYAGGGLWRPEADTAGKVRDAIVARPGEWKRVVSDPRFRRTCSIEEEKLVRPPRGVDPSHPLIEWLKYKDFIFFTEFTERDACQGGFLEKVADSYRAAKPYMSFLCGAMGLDC
jgi:uncharacterized protein (TIGR02453 family)